jgi:hypothetical protein
MTTDFSEDSKFIVDMEEYLDELLTRLPEDMSGVATTPAVDHMFKTRNSAPKRNKERAELCHRVTAKILFMAHRIRPELRMSISFLTK